MVEDSVTRARPDARTAAKVAWDRTIRDGQARGEMITENDIVEAILAAVEPIIRADERAVIEAGDSTE